MPEQNSETTQTSDAMDPTKFDRLADFKPGDTPRTNIGRPSLAEIIDDLKNRVAALEAKRASVDPDEIKAVVEGLPIMSRVAEFFGRWQGQP